MSKRIHELALPKGSVIPGCEVCGKKATVKCEKCRVTHYCCQEHKLIDFISFHKIVCDKMAYIRAEHPLPFNEMDRMALKEKIKETKQEVIKLALTVSRKWLLERKPDNSYPPAMIGLNMACELHLPESKELILPLIQVAEVFLKLGDNKSSAKNMVQASRIAQNSKVLAPMIIAKLNRLEGMMLMVRGKWLEARHAFSEFVHAVAVEYGAEDIEMAIPYGMFGVSLLKLSNVTDAMTNFHKMADKWLEFLLTKFSEKLMRVATKNEMASDENIQELEFQYMETKIVFEQIYEEVRILPIDGMTDRINFKILCFQALSRMRERNPKDAIVYKEEALVTALRTRQDGAVPDKLFSPLIEMLGEDYLLKWDKKHKFPRTVATKYLEMIKDINV